jgi:hypothetical protein
MSTQGTPGRSVSGQNMPRHTLLGVDTIPGCWGGSTLDASLRPELLRRTVLPGCASAALPSAAPAAGCATSAAPAAAAAPAVPSGGGCAGGAAVAEDAQPADTRWKPEAGCAAAGSGPCPKPCWTPAAGLAVTRRLSTSSSSGLACTLRGGAAAGAASKRGGSSRRCHAAGGGGGAAAGCAGCGAPSAACSAAVPRGPTL